MRDGIYLRYDQAHMIKGSYETLGGLQRDASVVRPIHEFLKVFFTFFFQQGDSLLVNMPREANIVEHGRKFCMFLECPRPTQMICNSPDEGFSVFVYVRVMSRYWVAEKITSQVLGYKNKQPKSHSLKNIK